MAASRAAFASKRIGVNPLSSIDLPRKPALDCSAPRSRKSALETNFSRSGASDAPASRGDSLAERAVRLEIGQAVDISEKIRRLEANWNRFETTSSDQDEDKEVAGTSGRQEDVHSRTFLEQRWQALSKAKSGSLRRRTRARRRRGDTISRAGHRERGSALALSHLSKLDVASQHSPENSQETQEEVSDSIFLAHLSDQLEQGSKSSEMATTLASVFGEWVQSGLLTRQTELELGRIVQSGLAAEKQLQSLAQEPPQSDPQEPPSQDLDSNSAAAASLETLEAQMQNGAAAQLILLRSNLKLVSSIARNFEGQGMELADLIVDGVSGLERAIQLYNPKKGLKFSTYAYMWIRQAMGVSLIENGRVIRLPSHVVEMVSQIAKARQRLTTQQHIDTPTDKQVAQSLGVSEEKVVLYTRLGRRHASLEDPGDGNALGARDEEDCLADVIEDHSPTAEDLIAQAEGDQLLRKDVDAVLGGLSIRERNILRFKYGMHTERLSLKQLSARYGISVERVRQIGEIALAKLQLRQASKGRPQEGRTKHVPYLKPEKYSLDSSVD